MSDELRKNFVLNFSTLNNAVATQILEIGRSGWSHLTSNLIHHP